MASCTSTSTQSSSLRQSLPLSPRKAARVQLADIAVNTIQRIVRDNQERKAGCKTTTSLLAKGCFYGNEYYFMLKEKKQAARLKFFLEKGSFFHNYLSKDHFTMRTDSSKPTGIEPNHFFLKKDVRPSDALRAIETGVSLVGCGEICQVGYFKAIQDFLSEEKFDAIFSSDSPTPLEIGMDYPENPFHLLVRRTEYAMQPDPTTMPGYYEYPSQPGQFTRGQIVNIAGIFEYQVKHRQGDASSYFSIAMDQERVTALGLDADGMILEEVGERLQAAFNSEPIGLEIVTETVAKKILRQIPPEGHALIEEFRTMSLTPEEFREKNGGKVVMVMDFNIDRLMQLKEASVEEAKALMRTWKR